MTWPVTGFKSLWPQSRRLAPPNAFATPLIHHAVVPSCLLLGASAAGASWPSLELRVTEMPAELARKQELMSSLQLISIFVSFSHSLYLSLSLSPSLSFFIYPWSQRLSENHKSTHRLASAPRPLRGLRRSLVQLPQSIAACRECCKYLFVLLLVVTFCLQPAPWIWLVALDKWRSYN